MPMVRIYTLAGHDKSANDILKKITIDLMRIAGHAGMDFVSPMSGRCDATGTNITVMVQGFGDFAEVRDAISSVHNGPMKSDSLPLTGFVSHQWTPEKGGILKLTAHESHLMKLTLSYTR